MNTASERIAAYSPLPPLRTAGNTTSLQYLRISLPQSQLTPQQLTELAGMIRRYSPRYALRLRSATQLEIAIIATQRPAPPEQVFNMPDQYVKTGDAHAAAASPSDLRVHVRGAQLHVRQLRVLAALMYTEGISAVRIADSETLVVENIQRGREAVLRLGLRETGLVTV